MPASQVRLPMNFQRRVCDRCLPLGEMRLMTLLVGRSMEEDHGIFWYRCESCGSITEPEFCPLYWLAAASMSELEQILSFEHAGAKVELRTLSDLSPPAREVLERVGANPLALAEVCAELALKRGAADARVKELEEELAERDG